MKRRARQPGQRRTNELNLTKASLVSGWFTILSHESGGNSFALGNATETQPNASGLQILFKYLSRTFKLTKSRSGHVSTFKSAMRTVKIAIADSSCMSAFELILRAGPMKPLTAKSGAETMRRTCRGVCRLGSARPGFKDEKRTGKVGSGKVPHISKFHISCTLVKSIDAEGLARADISSLPEHQQETHTKFRLFFTPRRIPKELHFLDL